MLNNVLLALAMANVFVLRMSCSNGTYIVYNREGIFTWRLQQQALIASRGLKKKTVFL